MARYNKKKGVTTALSILAVGLLVGLAGAVTKGFSDWKFDDNILENNDRKNLAKIDVSNEEKTSTELTKDTLVTFLESKNSGEAIVKGLGTKINPSTTEGGNATTSIIAPVAVYKADGGMQLGKFVEEEYTSGTFTIKLDEKLEFNRIAVVAHVYSEAVYQTEKVDGVEKDKLDDKGNKVIDHYDYDKASLSVNGSRGQSFSGNLINKKEVAKTETKVFRLSKATSELSLKSIDGRLTILEIQTWLE